jgi:hypothetical protein
MSVTEQIAKLSQELSPEKQVEVLDFVEFLVARQVLGAWTAEKRREVVAKTMGSLSMTKTSSDAFAHRKQEEKTKEERRWKS